MAIPFAAIGIGLQVLGSGKSIMDSIQQRRMARDAERAAAKATEEARKKLEINRMKELQVPLEPYRQAMRENTAQQMQNIQALQEAGTRTLIGGVGKVQGIAAAGTEQQRQAMEQALAQRDKMIASEQSRLDTAQANIDLAEAQGFQQMATDLTEQSVANLTSGIVGLGNAALTAQQQRDLFSDREARKNATELLVSKGIDPSMINKMTPQEIMDAQNGVLPNRKGFIGTVDVSVPQGSKPASDFEMVGGITQTPSGLPFNGALPLNALMGLTGVTPTQLYGGSRQSQALTSQEQQAISNFSRIGQ
jgi:DNA-binding transcriptional MerR regulator